MLRPAQLLCGCGEELLGCSDHRAWRVSRESLPRLNEEQSEPLGELPAGYDCLRTPHYVGSCSPHRKTSACQARQWILHVVLSAGSVLPLICTQWKFSTLARGKSWLLIVSYSIGGGVLFHCSHSLNAGPMGDHFGMQVVFCSIRVLLK